MRTPPAASASAARGAVADAEVTTPVETALQQSLNLHDVNIDVITLTGDMQLVGVLDSPAQHDEALQIAPAAGGCHSIHDELMIRK